MKIAVSAKGSTPTSDVGPYSGQNAGFVVYDSDNLTFSYIDNLTGQTSPGRKGSPHADMFVNAGIEVLVVSGIAFETARLLGLAGIKIYECISATVWEAIQALKLNLLESIGNDAGGGPDCRGVAVKSYVKP
jgi:predicted Fe-Mo cluster-binding NifX family protein